MSPMKEPPLWINAALLIGTLLVVSVCLDILVREADMLGGLPLSELVLDEFRIRALPLEEGQRVQSYECYIFNEHGVAAFIPNCSTRSWGDEVRIPEFRIQINSFGMRDVEYPAEKGSGTYRIFALGDSFTHGWGVNRERVYTEIVEQMLNGLDAPSRFEVFNLGLPGASTDREYQRLMDYLGYSPDLVLLQTLHNDLYECRSMREEIEALEGKSVFTYGEEFLRSYLDEIGPERRCSCVRASLDTIINRTRELKIPLIVFEIASTALSECFEDLNATDGFFLVTHAIGPGGRRYQLSRLDGHPNARGHEHLAGELLPILISVINQTSPEVLG